MLMPMSALASAIRAFRPRIRSDLQGTKWDGRSCSLVLLDSAETLGDLAALLSNRLEALRGDRAGQHSIRINAQWRVCFRWTDDGPHDVEIVDYH